jgi:alkanesulfonate monooxygenase SsuD/methylene tetrahydromethanopterin reductase-like flavin-dependent oxidoreductase (luciferase family)
MRFGAAFWIQRTGWPELRDAALAAERSGFDDLWLDDHLLSDEGDWRDDKLEGWTALAALAALTTRPRLGLLVAANTFRNPGLTAKLATTLDHISGGRAILGLGAGWFEREHEAFGLDFGASVGERLDWLAEALPLIRRLLDGEMVSHRGRRYALAEAVCRPKPIQDRVPILVGGSGRTKTLPLVARHADIANTYGTPELFAAFNAALDDACHGVGRDPATLERSAYLNCCIRDDAADAERLWTATRERHRPSLGEDRSDLVGTVDRVAATLRAFSAAGVQRVMLVFREPFDLETIARLPDLRARLETDG